jgi:hypothetical protein
MAIARLKMPKSRSIVPSAQDRTETAGSLND